MHLARKLSSGAQRTIPVAREVSMSRIVFVNGEFVPYEEARISVMDRGFLFADGIYEVAAVLGGRLVDNDAHLGTAGALPRRDRPSKIPIRSRNGRSSRKSSSSATGSSRGSCTWK